MLHLTKEFNDVNELAVEFARLAFESSQSAFKEDALTIEDKYRKLVKGFNDLKRCMADLSIQVNRYKTPKPVDFEKYEHE